MSVFLLVLSCIGAGLLGLLVAALVVPWALKWYSAYFDWVLEERKS